MIKIVILAFVILLLSWAGGMVKKEYSVLLGLCGMVLIFSIGLKELSRWFQGMSSFWQEIDSLAPYIKILLKMAGISYLSQFAVNACKDAGQQGLAGAGWIFWKDQYAFMQCAAASDLMGNHEFSAAKRRIT